MLGALANDFGGKADKTAPEIMKEEEATLKVVSIVFVVFPLLVGILAGLSKLFEWWERSAKEREKRDLERRKFEEEEKARESYFEQELARARLLKRTDEEIRQWARRNYKEILAREREIMEEANCRLGNGWREWFLQRPGGRELVEFYEEPLKELREAKRFVAEGGEFLSELERRLEREEIEAAVFKARERILRRLEERDGKERVVEVVNQEAKVEVVEDREEGERYGILGRIIQALFERQRGSRRR